MGGSPCQDLSIAGKRAGLKGERSSLVYVFADMVRYYKPRYFFLENVASMKKEDRDIITELMGVEPVEVNSALVSAQQRKRLYWTNISYTPPVDKLIVVENILSAHHYKTVTPKSIQITNGDKVYSDSPIRLGNINGRTSQGSRLYSIKGKSPALTAKYSGSDALYYISGAMEVRRLSPLECERLQTLPDYYTALGVDETGNTINIKETLRYKMIGNGWVVAVIEQFFKNIK